jgi:hypothetical protein
MPMQGLAALPLGDGSCVSAVGEVRGETVRAPGDASAAAGSKTGDCADEGRLFMNCINLESPGKSLSGRGALRPNRFVPADFGAPCGGSPGEDRWAGRPALAPLAKRSMIGNRNRNGARGGW